MFKDKDIQKIAKCLEAQKLLCEKDHLRLEISNKKEKRSVILELYPEVTLGKKKGAMIVVYTGNCHLQLHSCSGYVISEELGEVTFIGESQGKISGLVVEKGASCSLYANVVRDLISGDFTKFGVEVMLSGVALSLAEEIIEKTAKK